MMDRLAKRLVFAQLLDAATFLWFYLFIGAGIHGEQNPLILALMALGGLQMVAFAKAGLSLAVAWRRKRRTRPLPVWFARLDTIAISTATASGIVGAAFNSASILHSYTGITL